MSTKNSLEILPTLPKDTVESYTQLWQLENALRQLVYVEAMSRWGDAWAANVVQKKPAAKRRQEERSLTHMPVPLADDTAYLQFTDVTAFIEDNFGMFEAFLPPQLIWRARIEEVTKIRNRVAHFRRGHADDLARVVQLLKDFDNGYWRFCTSYNAPTYIEPRADPVAAHFAHFDPFSDDDSLPPGAFAGSVLRPGCRGPIRRARPRYPCYQERLQRLIRVRT